MDERIAIRDDESKIAELVSIHLQKAEFRVNVVHEVKSFLIFIRNLMPDTPKLEISAILEIDPQKSEVYV